MKINLLEDWEKYWGVEPYPTDGKEKQRKYYNHHAGESPEIITDENGDTIFRLNAVRHDEDNSYRTAAQYAFLDWIEKCKKKGLKPFNLKGRGRI